MRILLKWGHDGKPLSPVSGWQSVAVTSTHGGALKRRSRVDSRPSGPVMSWWPVTHSPWAWAKWDGWKLRWSQLPVSTRPARALEAQVAVHWKPLTHLEVGPVMLDPQGQDWNSVWGWWDVCGRPEGKDVSGHRKLIPDNSLFASFDFLAGSFVFLPLKQGCRVVAGICV